MQECSDFVEVETVAVAEASVVVVSAETAVEISAETVAVVEVSAETVVEVSAESAVVEAPVETAVGAGHHFLCLFLSVWRQPALLGPETETA